MSNMRLVKALVAERLAAAAEEIVHVVEGKTLLRTEMSPEQQRAVVHKRLSAVADDIFRILEIMMMGGHKARSRDDDDDRQRQLLDMPLKVQKSPGSPPESEFVHGKPPHLHQTHRAETDGETETRGERRALPPGDREVLSSRNPEAGSEDDEKSLKSNKGRRTSQRLRQRQADADCCETCGRSFHEDAGGEKTKTHARQIAATDQSQATGESCCRVCGKFFRHKSAFLKHVLRREGCTDLCGVCGKLLGSDGGLRRHLRTHSEEKKSCGDGADEEQEDAESEMGGGDEDWKESDGYGVDGVKDETKDGPKTKIHASNTPDGPKNKDCKDSSHVKYCCKVCGRSFCYRASFLKHVQEDETDADLCGVCGERFETAASLKLHLRTYIRTNDCDVCGKPFDGQKQLEMHVRTHTGEKPFVCSVCGKAFAQNGNLMGHMRAHTGERPYVCSVCGQSFGFKEYMTAHMRIHTGEKPFLCSVCGKGFRQRGTLKTHTMIHTGESTHRCAVCDKAFYKSGALKIHMRSHTGEKPYLCNVCGKSFTASSSLTKHMGVHEGQRAHGRGVPGREDRKGHAQTHGDEAAQLTSL
ncbi:zinc finger protein 391 isoform X1 [Scophthalmus maximus]|uniref:zinc finger protein 391 isoform X1 n=1 Tax=Scophthalmus maximus TaxID=52904 RepID=UPI001FA9281A|nr:zinc finger protein 391 isoform X1 [Scophthalmus maximus]